MHKKAYHYAVILNDSLSIMHSLRAIGNALSNLNMDNKALTYYNKALNWISPTDSAELSYLYNTIGAAYNRLGNYNVAVKYAELSENYQIEKEELPYIYTLKGHIYYNMNIYDSAHLYYEKSLRSYNLYTKAASCRGLYNIERKIGHNQQAIAYNEKYLLYRDSIEKQVHSETIIKVEQIYQNNKLKDENHRLQTLKIESDNKSYKISIIFIILIMTILAIYYSYEIKKRTQD